MRGEAHTPVRHYVLEEGGQQLTLLNLGVTTQDWRVSHRGQDLPIVLGYADPLAYLQDPYYLGAIVGRIANRVAGGRCPVGETVHQLSLNEGPNHLHGGVGGLSRQIWGVDPDTRANALRFTHHSPDGAEGYPGTVEFDITVSLSNGIATYDMRAQVDRPTPINLAQHNYYNLLGGGDVWGHELWLDANRYTPVGPGGIPTGDISPVRGGLYDFTVPTEIQKADTKRAGLDCNLVLNATTQAAVAKLTAPNGLQLMVYTDQPGLQVYSSAGLGPADGARAGQSLVPFGGICLEAQGFPNAINTPNFPSIMVTPDQPYHQRLSVKISEVSK